MCRKDYLISAIVSVYNCERFIAGCLEDLESQTILDRLEIVVVNSGSQENEEAIIRAFQKRFDNIIYIKTDVRETIYQAWNRGIKASTGEYLTNANADDRHRKDAFEVMLNELRSNNDIDFAYANTIITDVENETFDKHTFKAYNNWPDYDRHELFCRCYIGCQPMWRRRLHDDYGYFDDDYDVAGDYEFWLRISEGCKFKHIDEYLGLYLASATSAEHRNWLITLTETERAINKYLDNSSFSVSELKPIRKRQCGRAFRIGRIYYQRRSLYSARRA
jgi:glycosyltransferase involved in cell wall biosynthesis